MGRRDDNWDLQETFQYLGIIISFIFYEVLVILLILYKKKVYSSISPNY